MSQSLRLLAGAAIIVAMSATLPSQAQSADKIVIAHRGASGYLPEHTLAAKAVAHAQGADFIEQDVVLTKDGVPIVLHDIHLDTVTDVATVFPDRKRDDGRYYAIDLTLDEIKWLRVHERVDHETGKQAFPNRFPQGNSSFQIPTLAEEIELIQGLNVSTGTEIGIYPEIKKPAFHRQEGQDISKVVLATLAKYGYAEKTDAVFLQCFDWNETKRIRNELGYKGRLVQLIAENDWNEAPGVDFEALTSDESLREIAKVADGIGPWLAHLVEEVDKDGNLVTTGLSEAAQELGLLVHAYTFRADSLPEYAKTLDEALEIFLLVVGVDGVFTDFPDQAARFVAETQTGEAK